MIKGKDMKKKSYIVGALCDKGYVKKTNQDNLLVKIGEDKDGEFGLFIIADGMGGLAAGNIASTIAIKEFQYWWSNVLPDILGCDGKSTNLIRHQIKATLLRINEKIICFSNSIGEKMGTTLSVLFLFRDQYHIQHVGDSRVYKISFNGILQLTEDHSWVAQQVRMGNLSKHEAKIHPKRNLLTQCVGVHETINPFEAWGYIEEGDIFLLCSDGFHNLISEDEIYSILSKKYREDEEAKKALCDLVEVAKKRGATDNISVILIAQNKQGIFRSILPTIQGK